MKNSIFLLLFLLITTIGVSASKPLRLVIAGSTAMLPLSEHLATHYRKSVGVNVLVLGGGSAAGLNAVKHNIAEIAASSRPFTAEEKSKLRVFLIAHDIISIVVNPLNPINNITLEQLRGILSGEIKTWKELGAPFDQPIVLVNNSVGNGTREMLQRIIMQETKKDKINTTAITLMSIVTNSSAETKANIANSKYAIGYLPFNYTDSSVKSLYINNVPPTYAASYKGYYPLSRDLYYAIKNNSTDGLELAYIYYVLSPEGQDIVVREGFLPIKLITSIDELDRINKTSSR